MARRILILLVPAAMLALAAMGWTQVAARTLSGQPPAMAPRAAQADRIIVEKAARQLILLQGPRELARYDISLGARPEGHKAREGDERTPEGRYVIDWRNPDSVAHLSLHISYPDATDAARARAAGHDPGGNIMIHGLPNGWGWLGRAHLLHDWTNGCIALTNAEMREVWSRVPNGTPIDIRP